MPSTTKNHLQQQTIVTMTIPILNPYAKQKPPEPSNTANSSTDGAHQSQNGVSTNPQMGRQSQTRIPPTTKTKQLSIRRKKRPQVQIQPAPLVQRAVDNLEERAFNPKEDCVICKARTIGKDPPHRAHDERCIGNRTTRGGSAATVASDRESEALKKHFSAKMVDPEKERELTGGKTPGVHEFLRAMEYNKTVGAGKAMAVEKPIIETENKGGMLSPSSTPQEVAKFLEERVAARLAVMKPQPADSATDPTARIPPPAMRALVEEIMNQVQHSKPAKVSGNLPETPAFLAAKARFDAIFGGNNMVFEVPRITDSDHSLKPHFYSLGGSKFIYMDLELAFPNFSICCCNPECIKKNGGPCKDLTRKRDAWADKKRLFPIVDDTAEIWCRAFKYKCNKCNVQFNTNDGEFIASLPAFIRNQYPVDPRYAKGYAKDKSRCHLSKKLSQLLEEEMLSFSNACQFVKKILRRKSEWFLAMADDYYSRPNIGGDYPSIQEVVRSYPPNDQACRDLFNAAERSTLNPEGMAAKDRYERTVQSASIHELLAIDHTYETLKNYRLEDGKAIFTVLNEKGQICSLVIVASEKLEEVDHMLKMMLKRKEMNFNDGKKRGLYTDTWPNKKEYWEKLFGPNITGVLGLFHFQQRLTKHLNPKSEEFYEVLEKIQSSIYNYNMHDFESLMNAFDDGSITKQDGTPYSTEEVDQLRRSKAWKSNYVKYLRKVILNGYQVDQNLFHFDDWIRKFAEKHIPKGYKDLFKTSLEEFREQIRNNRKHANHIQDPEGIDMFRRKKPGKRAKIQLPTWETKRPESLLEMFHGLMRHFANTSQNPELADALTLRGVAEYNLQRERKIQLIEQQQNKSDDDPIYASVPGYLKDQPMFYNLAMVNHVNEMGSRGKEAPFPQYNALEPNTGEVFMSDYFKEQCERRKLGLVQDGLCRCPACQPNETNTDAFSASIAAASSETATNICVEISNKVTPTKTAPHPKAVPIAAPPPVQKDLVNDAEELVSYK